MYDIPAKSGRLDQRNYAMSRDSRSRKEDGERMGEDGEDGEDRFSAWKTGFREYWHIRNLLSASFPEIADLRGSIAFVNPQSPRPGSLCEIVSRRFDGDRAPENLLLSSYVR